MDTPGPQQRVDGADSVRAVGDLVGEGLAGVVEVAADAHRAVLDRVDSFLPPSARPVTGMTRSVTGGLFSLVGAAHRWAPVAVAEVVARTPLSEQPVQDTHAGRRVLPVVTGLWGSRVTAGRPSLAIPMAVRVGGRDLDVAPDDLNEAFPGATGHLVVFVHGLMEHDEAWWPPQGAPSFGDQLESELGATALYLRYDTGSRVSDNGEALAQLLEDLVGAWPVPVERISLVGHSMGGLVARSAGHAGDERGHSWVVRLATVVTLGTPHLGAPLAKATHVAAWGLARTPETAPYARVLTARSSGIRDLRHGAVVPADWLDRDPDGLLVDPPSELALLPHVTYFHVAATITSDPDHPAGLLVGDGMVRRPSASGRGRTRRIAFDPANGAVLGGVDHLALLHHPDAYALLREWIGPEEAATR